MGGIGSTRWARHEKKPLVEEAMAIDARAITSASSFENGPVRGTVQCLWGPDCGSRAVLALEGPLGRGRREGSLALVPAAGGLFVLRVALVQVDVGFSRRWHWECPLGCGRRARRLFVNGHRRRAGCRHCLALSYRSTQTWDSRVSGLITAVREADEDALSEHYRNLERPGYGAHVATRLHLQAVARLARQYGARAPAKIAKAANRTA